MEKAEVVILKESRRTVAKAASDPDAATRWWLADKAQAMEELQLCVYTKTLAEFLPRWDRHMESFIQAGALSDNDEAF